MKRCDELQVLRLEFSPIKDLPHLLYRFAGSKTSPQYRKALALARISLMNFAAMSRQQVPHH
jgi:hypothetical protein